MTDVDRQIARSAEVLDRSRDRHRALSSRARQRRNAALMRKVKYAIGAVLAIMIASAVAGFIIPLGTTGVMVALAAMIAAVLLVMALPGERAISPERLADTDLAALPLKTEIWLDSQRKALPAPAITLVDSIGVRLETLAPQLERLNPAEPAAQDIRRLLADHLPELVTGYQSIPPALRREERNGRVPEKQLIDGLGVIDAEIDRVTEQLAAGDLDKLATQNRFLELKYQEARELGH